jgi:hypothetical protein
VRPDVIGLARKQLASIQPPQQQVVNRLEQAALAKQLEQRRQVRVFDSPG